MDQVLAAAKDARMGFCAGLAVLAVQVPPHWSAWLSGELGEAQSALWIAAAAAVGRGLLAVAGKMAGFKMPWRRDSAE
jgi:hypothetical protein